MYEFEYIKSSISFEIHDDDFNRSLIKTFVDTIELNVNDEILDKFLSSHFDAELILTEVHNMLCLNYVNYKNNCISQNYNCVYVNHSNNDIYTMAYSYLPSEIRDQYMEICYFVLKKITEDYMLSKINSLVI